MKLLRLLPLLALAVLAGCSSSETEGFMAGDKLDLEGKPRAAAAAAYAPDAAKKGELGADPTLPPSAQAPQSSAPPSPAPQSSPSDSTAAKAEQRATLGYAPDSAKP